MLDIHFIRENADIVKMAAQKKKVDVDIDRLLVVDEERKAIRQQLDDKRAEQNRASGRISLAGGEERSKLIESMQHLKEGMKELEEQFTKATEEWTKLMLAVPNLPSPDTPEGEDEAGNKVVREWGKPTAFSFAPKAHWDIGRDLDIIDTDTAGAVSGARFSYLKGDLAMMQFALIQFAMKTLTSRETLEKIAQEAGLEVDTRPFVPVIPPVMVRAEVAGRMARLHPLDERYYFEKDDILLVGSAEHTLGPIHMDQILEDERLPIRYVGYSTAFRREAGAAGKDTRGILRQHQFDKIEMESFTRPEDGYKEQDFFVAIQEYLMRSLELPHQTLIVCTGDMGKPDQRQFDINTWMPGQDTYRETHTSDYMGSYQARRLNTRVRLASGDTTPVHMNDATAFAIGRTLIAILENYQQEDGSVRVPTVLVPYVGKEILGHNAG
ncbi:MAG: serine--tRNA ligase [Candidatus Pacebacteria bacterium]|nr:serine--tRNA ligase [Candidatus Paceibacterota bacterium]MBP9840438.1 serine--tRNA ligase [Candidatus Paceibacterota bacterium]